MKVLGVIIFSFIFLLTTMQEASFMLLYKLNEKTITEKYCINKNKVNSCCKGSCHLNNTLVKADTESTKNPFTTLNLKVKEIELIFNEILVVQHINLSKIKEHIFPNIVSNLLNGFFPTLLKPPCFLG
jgi:hypothetical protein